jgi:hypothetical protein
VTWNAGDSEQVACVRCLELKPFPDLDRMLWCEDCLKAVHARVTRRGWLLGLIPAVILSLWIWLYIQPSDLVIGGWIGTVLAAFYVSARVAREVLYAAARVGRRHAGETVPPGPDPH